MIRSNMLGLAAGILAMCHFSPDEGNTAVADAPATTGTPVPPAAKEKPLPNALEFCTIYNQSADRADALKRFDEAGFAMSYGALVARAKSYSDPQRKGGPIALKVLPPSPRGRRINTADINAKLAEQAAANAVKDEAPAAAGEATA